MEFKGTKGECTQSRIVDEPHISWITVKSEDGNMIAEFKGLHCGISNEQMNANAKLFIAAPELLEALQLIKDAVYDVSMPSEVMHEVEQAINKALN